MSQPVMNACGYLEAYIGDLEYVSYVGVSFWNEMGDGTPFIDRDAEDADEQMADYIGQVKKALAELREVKS